MKRFLAGLLLTLPMFGFAQSNFHKGYVLTKSKDTLKGSIDYREEKNTPVAFVFKQDGNASPKTYTPGDCLGYGINGIASYQSHVVNISLGTDDMTKLTEVADTSSKRERVFLQVIQAGQRVSFFYHEDPVKRRYYILDKGELEPQELIRQLYMKAGSSGTVLTDVKYARQLMSLLMKYGKHTESLEKRLGRLNYTREDLLRMIELINDQKLEQSKFPKSRFFVGAAINAGSIGFSGAHALAGSDASAKFSFGPAIAAGIDFFANPAIRRLSFRVEMALMPTEKPLAVLDQTLRPSIVLFCCLVSRSEWILFFPPLRYLLFCPDILPSIPSKGFDVPDWRPNNIPEMIHYKSILPHQSHYQASVS
jgi:hypothetical protein